MATMHEFCIKSIFLVIVSPGHLKTESVEKGSKM